jgi:hypothetical protein
MKRSFILFLFALPALDRTVAAEEAKSMRDGLIEKTEPPADAENFGLVVPDGAEQFSRDLYSEEIADALAERVAA